MSTNPLAVTAAGGMTRAMTTNALARSLPRNERPTPPPEARTAVRTGSTASNFWTRTTFRDAFGNPFAGCTGQMNLSADLVGSRSYFSGKTGAAGTQRGADSAGVRDPKPRTVERPLACCSLYSRTTYKDAFGNPFPLSAPLTLAATATLSGTQGGPGEYWQISSSGERRGLDPTEPRWPVGTGGSV
jgi:hypothetical protein